MNIKKLMSSKKMLKWILFGAVVMASNGLMSSVQTSTQAATVVEYKAKEILNSITYKDYLQNLANVEILSKIQKEDNKELNNQTIDGKTMLIKSDASLETADKSTLTSLTDVQYMEILSRLIVVTNMDTLSTKLDKNKKGAEIIKDLITRVKEEFEFDQKGIFKLKSQTQLLDAVMAKNNDLTSLIIAIKGGKDHLQASNSDASEVLTSQASQKIAPSNNLTKNIALLDFLMKSAFELVNDGGTTKKYIAPTLIDLNGVNVTNVKFEDMSALTLISKTDYDKLKADHDALKATPPASQQQGQPGNQQQNPAAVEFDITKVTKKEQIETMVSKNTKKALETELKKITDKKETLTDPEKAQQEAYKAALSLKMSSGMTTYGYPLIAASVGAVLGAGGTMLAKGGSSTGQDGSSSEQPAPEDGIQTQ